MKRPAFRWRWSNVLTGLAVLVAVLGMGFGNIPALLVAPGLLSLGFLCKVDESQRCELQALRAAHTMLTAENAALKLERRALICRLAKLGGALHA